MILKQTFTIPINGYWDGGPKRIFDWHIDTHDAGADNKGSYSRVGSWEANHWFHIATGRTEKQTLANARRRLTAMAKKSNMKCTFEYLNC